MCLGGREAWRDGLSGWSERKKTAPRGGFLWGDLFEAEAHAFGFFGAAGFADDGLVAALALRNRLGKTHLRFLEGHNSTLKDLAVETTDEVFVGLVLVFSSNFDCHIESIIPKTGRNDKSDFWRNYCIMGERSKYDYIDGPRGVGEEYTRADSGGAAGGRVAVGGAGAAGDAGSGDAGSNGSGGIGG